METHLLVRRAAAPHMRVHLSRTFLRPAILISNLSKPSLLQQHRLLTTTSNLGGENGDPKVTLKSDSKREVPNNLFLEPSTPHIKKTPPTWKHPYFDHEAMKTEIVVAHRDTRTTGDLFAYKAVRFFRWCTNIATGYRDNAKPGDRRGVLNERQWLVRIVFLESIAGVPGMVAGMLRHLHSLRRLKRDNGWIETLLEEAFNERMHLLTFLKITSPGLFMRTLLLGAQGVFFNGFFLSYLISPSICHRFVGYLEEEAVATYTHCIKDLEAGKLPLWEKMPAPEIAVEYWQMPEGKRMMKDLLYYVRADEAKHREVNHTLGNLDPSTDPNPFVSEWEDPERPHPSKGLKGNKATGWERDEAL